jgi:transcriptional regulator with PAS, ATPase and Fis domain
LLESELFGHEAGAFSGARARKLGLFEIADSGTLFLDEVMEMPMALQSKLLRALETRSFFRVGGVKKVEVDVRLVAATNRNRSNLPSPTARFRSDLLYRINSFEIQHSAAARTPRRHRAAGQHFCRKSPERMRPNSRRRPLTL